MIMRNWWKYYRKNMKATEEDKAIPGIKTRVLSTDLRK